MHQLLWQDRRYCVSTCVQLAGSCRQFSSFTVSLSLSCAALTSTSVCLMTLLLRRKLLLPNVFSLLDSRRRAVWFYFPSARVRRKIYIYTIWSLRLTLYDIRKEEKHTERSWISAERKLREIMAGHGAKPFWWRLLSLRGRAVALSEGNKSEPPPEFITLLYIEGFMVALNPFVSYDIDKDAFASSDVGEFWGRCSTFYSCL